MKTRILYVLAVTFLVWGTFLKGTGFATTVSAATGDWESGTTWGNVTNIPTSSSTVIINDNFTVTVSSGDAAVANNFGLGTSTTPGNSNGLGTLDITGGSLTMGANSYVGRSGTNNYNTTTTLNLSGGELVFGTSSNSYFLGIGSSESGISTNNVASAYFSGGTFQGGLTVGNTSATIATGTLYVEGNSATIGAQYSGQTLTVNSSGTLDFVLNSSGQISVLNYGSSVVTLGGTLDINVGSYTGGTETINLIDYGSLSGSFATLALIGTGAANYSLTTDTNSGVYQAVLTEVAVPEPETWVLVFMGMTGLAAVVRRKATA